MRALAISALISLVISTDALAQPVTDTASTTTARASGTNYPPLTDYPSPTCVKPGPVPRKPSTINNGEVDRYNALIASYNKVGHDYAVCINAYIRNTDNDMDLIRKKSRDAADEANR